MGLRSSEREVAPRLEAEKLTTVHAIGQSLAIGPIFSAGAVMATVAAVSGINTPLAVLFAFIGSICLAYVVSLYARRFAGAGAMYEYLAKGVTNSFGIFSGGIYVLGLMFLGAGGVYLEISNLVQGFFQAHVHTHVPYWIGGTGALLLVLALNYLGVRVAVRGVLALAMFSAIPFTILAIVIIVKGGAGGNTLSVFDPSHTSWNSVFKGILFGVTLFIGFEAAASIAEETHNPRRSIPIAVLGTVLICGVFFLLVGYAASIGFGEKALGANNAWAAAPSGYGALAQHYVGSWLSVIIDLTIILDAVSLSIAFMVTGSRMFFALGRDGLLPKAAAATSRFGTPTGGIAVIGAWSVVMLLWGGLSHYGKALGGAPNAFAAFLIANAAGSYLVELIYVFLAVFALRLVWQSRAEGGLWWKLPAVLAGLATPILAFKGSLDPFPAYPLYIGFWLAIGLIGLTGAWWLVLRIVHPARIQQAAAYAVHDAAEGIRAARPDTDAAAAPAPVA
jgi:amino acid transporter